MSVVESGEEPHGAAPALVVSRLAMGATQGLALYLLYRAAADSTWPATDPYRFAPLVLIWLFAPVLFLQGVGTLRLRTLIPWMALIVTVLGALAWYGVWRAWPSPSQHVPDGGMLFGLLVATFAGLFIAQSLVLAGDTERKFVAGYRAHFEAATKLAVQFAATVAFVAVFWGVLWLGAVLFNLIKLSFLETLLEKDWFAIPATALASAAAIHVTDVRARLWTGIRTVASTLLSWLLPLMTLIAAGFTMSLVFTGLAPLWATREAAGLLLGAAGAVVILLNTAYQDGVNEHSRATVFRIAEFVAALVLVPLVMLAAYAVWLRVGQYGWTVERVFTGAAVAIALCYAIGYAAAALLSLSGGTWMRLVAPVNVATAFAAIAVLLALFSPLGDPARLAVASQVARLRDGKVAASAFDYSYLRSEGVRYGHDALVQLASGDVGKAGSTARRLAQEALSDMSAPPPLPPVANLAVNLIVFPRGAVLPASFLKQEWRTATEDVPPACLRDAGVKCEVFVIDFAGDGHDDVLVLESGNAGAVAPVYAEQPDGKWAVAGRVLLPACGPKFQEAMRSGNFKLVPRPFRDLSVNGLIFPFADVSPTPLNCR
ncbi:MAG TPA: hypothetical protein VJ476_02875 [Rhizomicrobium sp.]|nr:hypothetical protein [Rhizomicrobium sp.]